MPYYIYRIREPLKLEYIDNAADYKEAKARVRVLREAQASNEDGIVRMVFAKTTTEAEKLLSTPRDERVIGED